MLSKQLLTFCFAGLLGGGALLPVAAQTGRIAQFSHGGSAAADSDNFGLPDTPAGKSEYVVDSLVRLDATWARSYNRSRSVPYGASEDALKKAPWQAWEERVQYQYPWQTTWQQTMRELRERYPQVKLSGFGNPPKPARKKPAGRSEVFPKRPFQYSYWRMLAGVAALGAVGGLLGKKRAA